VLAGDIPEAAHVLVYATDQTLEPLAAADALAVAGARVTFAVPYPGLGAQVEAQTRLLVLDRLRVGGVQTVIRAQWQAPVDGRPVITSAADPNGGPLPLDDVDLVVLGLGSVACDELAAGLSTFTGRFHVVGDSFAPRQMVAATQQAYAVGCEI
jgi:hypothetical protein